ncbi:hypothetical protein [Allochromatium vinosum]|nr:hypothetical protein [Allochromatium vinosum]
MILATLASNSAGMLTLVALLLAGIGMLYSGRHDDSMRTDA